MITTARVIKQLAVKSASSTARNYFVPVAAAGRWLRDLIATPKVAARSLEAIQSLRASQEHLRREVARLRADLDLDPELHDTDSIVQALDNRLATQLMKAVRDGRAHLGLSTEQLAERIGVEASYIEEIETFSRPPNDYVAVRLADALGLNKTEILHLVITLRAARRLTPRADADAHRSPAIEAIERKFGRSSEPRRKTPSDSMPEDPIKRS